jgi:hypothetical protein
MKHASPPVLAAVLMLHALPAMAEEGLAPASGSAVNLASALGKQVDVRFSGSFAKGRLAAPDIDGVIIYELPPGKICLFGQGKGLDAENPALAEFANPNGGGDICVALADVSLRLPPRQQAEAGAPPPPFYSTDRTSCSWIWEKGKGIGLWTESCKFDTGLWDVIYDGAKDLFALRVDAGEPYPVLRQFRKAGGAQALLPELKASGLVLDDAECVMAQVADQPSPPGWTAWQVVPTGKRKEAFDSVVQVEVPEPPCGEIGYRVDLVGFFMVNDARPDRVLYVNLGQDGTMIDIGSITLGD